MRGRASRAAYRSTVAMEAVKACMEWVLEICGQRGETVSHVQ